MQIELKRSRRALSALMLGAATAGTGAPAAAQQPVLQSADLAALPWRSVGPAVAGGRITDIEVSPTRKSTLYVGAASGGVFRSTNHGTTWEPVFDEADNLSVGDIAIAPSNPEIVWVGTGEANNRNSSPWGAGLYKSSDGGDSWEFVGLEETRHVGRIVVHPTNPEIVYVAALGHLFGPNPERGVFRTTDGGRSWDKIKYIDENTGFVDLVMDPTSPTTLYAAAYQRQRRAFGFAGGGPGSGLHKSTDGGESWQELTQGLPTGDKGRIGLAISTRNPRLLMATVEARGDGGIYRSEDAGATWVRVNELNPRPMYYSKIRIDPGDNQRIYVLGTQLHRSEDGGHTFHEVRLEDDYGLGVHVDNHAMWIDPDDSDHVLLGNDGGFYFTFDRGANWEFSGNLPIQQFYDVALDMEEPYNIYGGLQDNNSYRGPSAVRRWQGILNQDWQVVDYGDGMYAAADPTDSRFVYINSQGGAIQRVDPRTGDRKAIQPAPRDTSEQYRFDWMSPILISPHDARTVYLGGNRLFRSADRGVTWTESKDLSRGIDRDSLPIMGMRVDSTTLSRNDGTSGYGEITTIAESRLVPGLLWVGLDDGAVQVSRDGGGTWTEVSGRIRGLPHPMFVSRVETSNHSAGRAYVSFDGHWDDDYRPYLFVTDDYGETWRSLSGSLPASTVNVVREHPSNPDVLLVGTEDGPLVSFDAGRSWTRLGGAMPRVPVDDIEVHPRDNDLVVATHGRGIWILDDMTALSAMTPEVAAKRAHLFPTRPTTLFQYRNSVPTLGHGIFRAPNPPFGALVSYHLGADQPDSVTLRVYDGDGRVIRTLRGSGAKGIHRVAWDLRLASLPQDTTHFRPPSLDVGPRGPLVMPGTYVVELSAVGTAPQRTAVEVRPDPLMPVPADERRARFDFTVALYELQQDGYFAAVQVNQLARAADAALDSLAARPGVDSATVSAADSVRDRIRTAATALRTQNASLRGWWRGLIGEFDGGTSTTGTMTGPTEAQRRRLEMTRTRFAAAIAQVDDAIREVPDLNALLRAHGVKEVPVASRGTMADTP